MSHVLIALLLLATLLSACGSAPEYPHVSLAETVPPATPATSATDQGEAVPLRVAIATAISPKRLIESYGPFCTQSRDNSIQAGAEGLVDGRSVSSLEDAQSMHRDLTFADWKKPIERSWAWEMLPEVPLDRDTEQKVVMRDVQLTMHRQKAGQGVLAGLKIDRFVPIDGSADDSVRQALDDVGAAL